MSKHWMQTFSGEKFFPLNPQTATIKIEDIAHALSLTCRFGGHCKQFYSVAQHSCLVSDNCSDKLGGLLHDAAEAYLVDLPRPIKNAMRFKGVTAFDDLESIIMETICQTFNITIDHISVKAIDNLLLATEARDLMSPLADGWMMQESNGYPVLKDKIIPWSSETSFLEFLQRFNCLTKGVEC